MSEFTDRVKIETENGKKVARITRNLTKAGLQKRMALLQDEATKLEERKTELLAAKADLVARKAELKSIVDQIDE